jgi:ribokinase
MLGAVGDDTFGETLLKTLQEAGVQTDSVVELGDTPTGTAYITVEKDGQNRIVVAPGANGEYSPERFEQSGGLVDRCAVLCCSLEVPVCTVTAAAQRAHRAGKTVVVDPAPAQTLPEQLLEATTVLTPNLAEAAGIVNRMKENTREPTEEVGAEQAQPEKLVKELLELGVPHVLLTLGERGVLYGRRENESTTSVYIRGHDVPVEDTTAAGDAFAGALAVRLAQGHSVFEAAVFANAAGGLAVTKQGAQPSMPTQEAVQQLLNQRQTTPEVPQ